MAPRPSIEGPDNVLLKNSARRATKFDTLERRMGSEEHERAAEAGEPPSHENCDSTHNGHDSVIKISSTSKLAGQTVSPFLAKHIPEQYAPLGAQKQTDSSIQKDPNTKYCYRHRPDSKCRRTVDEPTMENLQWVCVIPSHRLTLTDDICVGTRITFTSRPAGHISCLVVVLCCPSEASKLDATGHSHSVLLSTTFLPL